jgi:hypothetical protein
MLEDLHKIPLSRSKFSFLLEDSIPTFPPFSRHDDRSRGGNSCFPSTPTCSRCSGTLLTTISGLSDDARSDVQPNDQSVLETLDSTKSPDLAERKKKALHRAMEEHKSVCGNPFRGYTDAQGQILEVLEERWKAAEGKEKSDEMRLDACKDQLSKLVRRNAYAKNKAFSELEDCFYETKNSGETWKAVVWVFDHTCEDRIGWDRPRDICDTCSRYVFLPKDWEKQIC